MVDAAIPRRLGATVHEAGTDFELWAPAARNVDVVVDGVRHGMEAVENGHHRLCVTDVEAGARYGFSLDGGPIRPDPSSRSQPDGVHEPSEVIPMLQAVQPPDWSGVGLGDLVIYELHVGTFTADGTFAAVIPQLDRLAKLGITAIELMPIAQFPGDRNWGYDGVYAFAAQSSYGGRQGLIQLVEAAHQRGIAVLLDVVHNHVGPEGNYLSEFGPYFTDRFHTGWGWAMNMTEPGSDAVRRHFIASAVEWVEEVGLDGLRLDAVHAIVDQTSHPFLEQLNEAVSAAAAKQGRRSIVIAESSDNDPRFVTAADSGGYGCDAVWNDDLHHGIRVELTGDRTGYYADYSGLDDIEACFRDGWKFTGQYSIARGRHHGRELQGRTDAPDGTIPFQRLVVCDQNHDQIGNRAAGDRLDVNVTEAQRRLAAATVCLGPFTPMLFMGEEYGERAPFPYFVSHGDPELIEAVRVGRRNEFPQNDQDSVPDPAAIETFQSAVLNHSGAAETGLSSLYTSMFSARHQYPAVTSPEALQSVARSGDALVVTRTLGADSSVLVLNYGPNAMELPLEGTWMRVIDTASPEPDPNSLTGRCAAAGWSAVLLVMEQS